MRLSFPIMWLALSGLSAFVIGDPQRRPPPPPTTTTTTEQPRIINLVPVIAGVATSVANLIRPVTQAPANEFSCRGRVPGYYADVNSGCRNYFTCSPGGRRDYYSCGERTIFNQWLLICDHWRNYDCRLAPFHYEVNERRRPFEDRPNRRPRPPRKIVKSYRDLKAIE